MTRSIGPIPIDDYGVLLRDSCISELDELVERIRRLGYAILDSGYSEVELANISKAFNQARDNYVQTYGEARLRNIKEYHTIRALLTHGDSVFLQLATNQHLLNALNKLIIGKCILNQQNGIINPPEETFSQGAWHRDLPYQHFISTSPLAVNALFCIDDFTEENGATFVLPATHQKANFPSSSYVQENALQITAKAGQYILLDCMLFHSGGFNRTCAERRAVNHVFTIPYFKQQIKFAGNIELGRLTPAEREILGIDYQEPLTIEQFLLTRDKSGY